MLNVRLAVPSDRDEAIRLARGLLIELGGNPAPPDALSGVFDGLTVGGDAGFIVIAEEDGKAVAVCTASFATALRTAGRYVILQEMYVEPESRGSGVGRAVINFALEHAAACGCRVVELGAPPERATPDRVLPAGGFREHWRKTPLADSRQPLPLAQAGRIRPCADG